MIRVFLFVLTAIAAFGARDPKQIEVCLVAEVQEVDGKLVPQRGVRIYQRSDGSFYGAIIRAGLEQLEFGGGTRFRDDIAGALAGLPTEVVDWNKEIESAADAADKVGRGISVLDGWNMEVRVATSTVQIDLVRYDAGAYIMHLAPFSRHLESLNRLIETIAVLLGREQMAL